MNRKRFTFSLPDSVAMIASAVYRGGENFPTIECAVYRKDFDAGIADARLVWEDDFGDLRLRVFFPSSGCGIIVKNGKMTDPEAGLQNFSGKAVSVIKPKNRNDVIVVVWTGNPPENAETVLGELIPVVDALSRLFT